MPAEILPREAEARREMLETLSEFDDTLLEQLIEDIAPEKSLIYRDLHDEFGADQIVPVLLGAGDRENGVRRLLKALRHDTPFVGRDRQAPRAVGQWRARWRSASRSCTRRMPASSRSAASGRAALSEGQTLGGQRIGAMFRPFGQRLDKIAEAKAGEIVALAKLDALSAGQTLIARPGIAPSADFPPAEPPVFALALAAKNRNDEVKLSGALHKIVEEDPSLAFEARGETHELLLKGQGEMHLKVAVDKLAGRYNVAVETAAPRVAYRETIQAGTQQHARYKRQTGGHGQFADIKVEIQPLPRGSGFRFVDKIVGGVVPRNFIPAVEEGLDRLPEGGPARPAGGRSSRSRCSTASIHAVDSSEMSFKMAARIAMSEAMPKCRPVLLEPILKVTVAAPERLDVAHPAADLRPARPAAGLRHAARLERLGRGLGADAGSRDRRHDRRDPLGDPGRRHLPHRVRPSAGAGRPHRRAHRRGDEEARGGLTPAVRSQGGEDGVRLLCRQASLILASWNSSTRRVSSMFKDGL